MKIKTYRAATIKDALAEVKKELGDEAFILGQKEVAPKKVLGVFGKNYVEVTAAVDYPQDEPAPVAAPEDIPEPSDSGDRVTLKQRPSLAQPKTLRHKQKENQVLLQEIRELRSIVESIPSALPSSRTTILHASHKFSSELCSELYADLIENGMDQRLAAELVRHADSAQTGRLKRNKTTFRSRMLEYLGAQIRTTDRVIHRGAPGKPNVIALVGPTGVGKTTTIAKLAAKAALEDRLKVALITSDTFRIAAIDQLKAYAEIMSIPVRVAGNAAEIDSLLTGFSDKDLVFIDTAGCSPRDLSGHRELADFLSKSPSIQKGLLLSATTRQSDLSDLAEKYKMFAPDWIIVTKLDETEAHGAVACGVIGSGKPLAYVTVGQGVPQDIIQPSAAQIARLAVSREDGKAWQKFLKDSRKSAVTREGEPSTPPSIEKIEEAEEMEAVK